MTRVVEAHAKVLVMRNPKTESKEKFMARAEELAERLYEEPDEEGPDVHDCQYAAACRACDCGFCRALKKEITEP
ncbi:hypothetical protein [Stenotrophomonas phage BUCTxx99]|nr:hypothetical protein [Stenotrophomonas phage BUCTxx99]